MSAKNLIPPSPGRIVWFYPAEHDGIGRLNGQPLAAIVAGVHNDRLVNLAVFDAYGNTQQRSNVDLIQPDTTKPDGGSYATWMPYQIGQKAKTEQLQAQITPPPVVNADAMFAETDGTSASETGLVSESVEELNTQSPDEGGTNAA